MKQFLRLSLLFVTAMVCILLLSFSVQGQQNSVSPDPPLSALQFDPQQFKAALDQDNIADAVRQLEVGWKQQFDEYHQRQLTSRLLPAQQISQSLSQIAEQTGTRSALVYAISVPNQLEVILLLPNGQLIHHREQAATPEVVTDVSRALRVNLVNVNAQPKDYLPAAQQLYQWLIAPIQPTLEAQGIDNLIFCLGRGLRSVPMAALHDGNGFLIESYSISLIPAFNLLDRRPTRLSGLRVLAMGASEFSQQESLPAVPVELAAIAQLWSTEVLLNEQFTVAQLREKRSQYPFGIVHLATHASFESGSARDSYIQFWNRTLRLTQLRELGLLQPVVQLLVLSACRTALGDASAELGFAGLAVQSGAKAAVASLWAVSDTATVVTMIDFYQNLRDAPAKVEALRQTQLAMLRGQLHLESVAIQQVIQDVDVPVELTRSPHQDFSHPYYWAGFTMIGNPW